MFRSVRKPAHLLLSVLMAVEVMFPLHLHAQTTPIEALAQSHEFSAMLENSRKTAAGLPKDGFAPDRFLLLEQQAHPRSYVGRNFSIAKSRREREIEVHEARADRAQAILDQSIALGAADVPNACEPFPGDAALELGAVKKAVLEHLSEGRRKDTPLFVWNEKKDPARAACLRELLTTIVNDWRTRIDNEKQITEFGDVVPNITEAEGKAVEPYYNWWEVQIDAVNGDELVDSIKMSRSADYSDLRNSSSIVCKDACAFELKARGLKINTFHLKVKALATFGPYVVFTHEDSYDKESGLQYVSFLDLKSYNNLLGKEEIPVFTIPITEFEGEIHTLSVQAKTLVMNGTHSLPLERLIMASEVQRALFNISANLLDPEETASLMPYAYSMDTYMEKVVKNEFDQIRSAANDTKTAKVDFVRMGEAVQKELEMNQALAKLSKGKPADLTQEEFAQLPDEMHKVLDTYAQQLTKSQSVAKAMKESNRRVQMERGMMARIKALYNRVMTPVPNASLKVKRALILVGAQQNVDQGKFMNQLLDRPWLAAAAASAAVIATVSPNTYDLVLDSSLATLNGIVDYLRFTASGIGGAAAAGTKATFEPLYSVFAPLYTWGQDGGSLYNAYVANGNWMKTGIGIGAFTGFIASIYLIPHMIFNVHHVLIDRKYGKRNGEWKGFVQHQKDFVKAYLQRLADDEAVRRGMKVEAESKVSFTAEEDRIAIDWVAERVAQRKPPGMISRLAGGTKKAFLKLAEAARLYNPNPDLDKERVRGTWSAITSLAFSGPAMELTLTRWAGFWNWFSGVRYTTAGFLTLRDLGLKHNFPIFVRPKPISLGVRLFLPNFFHTVVTRRGPKVTLPTSLNGGTRTWELRDITWYKEKVFGKAPLRLDLARMPKPESKAPIAIAENSEALVNNELQLTGLLSPEDAGNVPEDAVADQQMPMVDDSPIADEVVAQRMEAQYLEDVVTDAETREVAQELERELNASEFKAITENFEDAVLPLEDAIYKVAFDEAMSRMADFLGNKQDLVNLFTAKPIHSVIEKRVREMPVKVRTFLRLYSDRVYEATMKQYLSEALATETAAAQLPAKDLGPNPKLMALKRQLIATRTEKNSMQPFHFDSARAKAIAEEISEAPGFYEAVRDQAKKGELAYENWRVNRKYNIVSDMDPSQNRSMERYAEVQKRLKSPTALARAVRSEISKLIITFPLDLGFKLLFAASIYEGAFKPIQDSMWGENSAAYLSWTSFYYSFGMGFTISMMADAWMKLQVDARQDNLGDFGIVPMGEDAEKNFLRWYGKQWNAKNNSITANWAYSNKLVFHNIPAFLVNLSAFSLVFGGRIDLSYMLAGFPITFGTPWGAFNQKIDQTFERAAEFPARGIPDEKYLSHPKVQEYLTEEKQRLRNKFQQINDLYGNIAGSLQGNIMLIPTALGPRGFTRAMLGGYLIEELVVNKVLQPINYVADHVPVVGQGVKAVTGLCEHILTNGNVDLTKLKK